RDDRVLRLGGRPHPTWCPSRRATTCRGGQNYHRPKRCERDGRCVRGIKGSHCWILSTRRFQHGRGCEARTSLPRSRLRRANRTPPRCRPLPPDGRSHGESPIKRNTLVEHEKTENIRTT